MGQRVSLASHIQTDGVSDRQKTDRSRSSTGKHGSLSAGNRFGLSDNSRMVSGDDSYGGSHDPDRIRKKEHIHKVSGRVISGRMAAWRYDPVSGTVLCAGGAYDGRRFDGACRYPAGCRVGAGEASGARGYHLSGGIVSGGGIDQHRGTCGYRKFPAGSCERSAGQRLYGTGAAGTCGEVRKRAFSATYSLSDRCGAWTFKSVCAGSHGNYHKYRNLCVQASDPCRHAYDQQTV